MNRRLSFALRSMSGLSLLGLAASSAAGVQDSIPASSAREAFAQVRRIADEDDGQLWGLRMDYPVLFIDPDSRECVADRGDGQGRLSESDGVWRGVFPADKAVANATTQWAGTRWTMLIWPLPGDEVSRAQLLLHECFHNAQPELGISGGANLPCDHLGTYDGRLWLRLEARALTVALEREGYEREEAAGDALLFRAFRRSLFPGSALAEDDLERHEGSAEYTGIRLSAPDPEQRAAPAVRTLRGLAQRPSLTRSFQYGTGPAMGLLLDEYDPYWRESFLGGASFTALLEPVLQFEPDREEGELEETALRRAEAYGMAEVVTEETERERLRQVRLDAYRARYLAGPQLVLPGGSLQRSFDPSRIEALDDVGSVYGVLWASSDWGVLDAPGGALVLGDLSVHLPAPSDVVGGELAGDGWTLELAAGWRVVPGEREGDYRAEKGDR